MKRQYDIRNCSSALLTLDCSVTALDNTPSAVFALQSSDQLVLQPGEITSLIVSYTPHSVQEDVALLKLQPTDPALTHHAVCLVGYGGQSQPEIKRKEKVMISNSGNRTACFFVVDGTRKDFALVRSSNVLPPYFMLPPMMEFGVDARDLYNELLQRKVEIGTISDMQIPPVLHIVAIDNVLRRRFLLGVNQNALMESKDPFELLLYAVVKESNDALATTRSLLKTMSQFDGSNVDIMKDIDDGERVSDLDTLLGYSGGKTHYADLDMMVVNCLRQSILVETLGQAPPVLPDETPLREDASYRSPQEFATSQPFASEPREVPLQPRVHDHQYQCPLTDPYDRLVFDQMNVEPTTAQPADDRFNISPSMLYLTSDMVSPSECRVCNFSARRVNFQVVSPPQELDVKPLSGVIEPYSTCVVTVE